PVDISVPVISSSKNQIPLEIHYQGCSKQGFCYPPQTRMLTVTLGSGTLSKPMAIDQIPNKPSAAIEQPKEIKDLMKHHYHWTVWLGFFGLGVLISLTPCVLPMIPVLSSLILGKADITHLRAFLISLAYVLGMAITYAIAGLAFGAIGGTLQAWLQKPWVISIFSAVIVAMALSLFGLYQFNLPELLRSRIAGLSNRQRHGSIIGAVVMGGLSTLILSPCATAPLVAVLSYISQAGNAYLGALALFLVGMGSGVPLLLVGAFGKRLLPRAGKWMRQVENILGIGLLAVAIWMLSRIFNSNISLILWAALGFGIAIYLKAFTSSATKVQMTSKIIGILIFIFSIILLTEAINGTVIHNQIIGQKFVSVKTIADVQQQMAQANHKPVFLDFYAKWCVNCKYLESHVLTNPAVQKQLQRFLLLRADITANDPEDRALMREYGVVAPPTFIVFNSQHVASPMASSVGELSAKQLTQKLASVD
ncbi:MAG: protein-disulfide reductase DsbD, partial [Proteobacteria bacterium]|nr:protein-disulfide reductase DsbD [Pseudomonadota bacterium]